MGLAPQHNLTFFCLEVTFLEHSELLVRILKCVILVSTESKIRLYIRYC